MTWAWLWWALTAIFFLNALRLRGHAAHLRVLPPGAPGSGDGTPTTWHWVTAAGVDVPEALRVEVERYAAAEGLQVLDVVPRDLPAEQALQLAGDQDPVRYRQRPLAPSLSAWQAAVVDAGTWERVRWTGGSDQLDPVAMFRLVRELRRHAPTASDIVVAPGARAAKEDLAKRRAVLRTRFGPAAGAGLWFPLVRTALLVLGVVFFPLAGGVAAGAWCLQPFVALAGTPLRPRDLAVQTLFRWVAAPLMQLRAIAGRWQPEERTGVDTEALRPTYQALLADGLTRFFEERRADCPICGAGDLAVQVRGIDLVQRKPGRFVLERCRGCGHVFQNPRLSLAGLDFYYRDFYDGIGEEQTELLFGVMEPAYTARAAMLADDDLPASWIDIGAGHGHFCLSAKQRWPATRFDGLDMSESIEAAERRGWVEKGYRGLLLDLAPELAGRYEVVSMHHYLEHTREPLAELDAAVSLLAPGGRLLIELPDPESRWGRLLGRYWVPWFQPQHQHMMPMALLESALSTRGLEIVKDDLCHSESPVNLTAALLMLAVQLAPPPGMPWRKRSRVIARVRFALAGLVVVPLVPVFFLVDRFVLLWTRRHGHSNAYRVLARLTAPATAS